MRTFYFEVLPEHPKPEKLEALSQYIIRICELNDIWNSRQLSELIAINLYEDTIDDVRSFGNLPTVVQCSEDELRSLTTFHFLKKFGREDRRFLGLNFFPVKRYCPSCLADRGYYSLLWRFWPLLGCPFHSCYLVDRCGHCGSSIPLFKSPFHLFLCPVCKKDLRTCPAEKVSKRVLAKTKKLWKDIEMLFSPQPWEHLDRISDFLTFELVKAGEGRNLDLSDLL